MDFSQEKLFEFFIVCNENLLQRKGDRMREEKGDYETTA